MALRPINCTERDVRPTSTFTLPLQFACAKGAIPCNAVLRRRARTRGLRRGCDAVQLYATLGERLKICRGSLPVWVRLPPPGLGSPNSDVVNVVSAVDEHCIREYLDVALFWTAVDLESKLSEFRDYYNLHRSHAGRGGKTPEEPPDARLRDLEIVSLAWPLSWTLSHANRSISRSSPRTGNGEHQTGGPYGVWRLPSTQPGSNFG